MEEKKKVSLYKKMTPEELQGLLHLRKRGRKVLAKKGKVANTIGRSLRRELAKTNSFARARRRNAQNKRQRFV